MGKTLALLDCPDPNNNPEIGMEKFSEVMPAEPPFNFSQFLRRVLVLSASQRKQAEKKRAAKNAEIYGTVISAPMTEAEAIAADIHNNINKAERAHKHQLRQIARLPSYFRCRY